MFNTFRTLHGKDIQLILGWNLSKEARNLGKKQNKKFNVLIKFKCTEVEKKYLKLIPIPTIQFIRIQTKTFGRECVQRSYLHKIIWIHKRKIQT